MKLLVVVCVFVQLIFVNCYTLSDILPEACHKFDPGLNECFTKYLLEAKRRVVKGVPENNIPVLDPLELAHMSLNRTFGESVTVNAELQNIRIVGIGSGSITDLKFDPKSLIGEVWVAHPSITIETGYDVTVHAQGTERQNRGYFRGSFSDLMTHVKINLKEVERNGVRHFASDKVQVDATIGDGNIKLATKNSRDQAVADMITTYFNSNPKHVLDAVNPFYASAVKGAIGRGLKRVLALLPAEKILSE